MGIGLIIYTTGCIIAGILGCVEIYKYRNEDQSDIGLLGIFIICSWLTIIIYVYGFIVKYFKK